MDNLGDWIYIVFLIIAAVSGLFSSKNKKKRPTQVLGQPGHDTFPEENTSSGKGFWEILEEMQNPKPAKQPVATPPAPFPTAKKMTDRQSPVGNRIVVPPVEEENSFTDIEFDNAAELRKAVIYTEILNRKY